MISDMLNTGSSDRRDQELTDAVSEERDKSITCHGGTQLGVFTADNSHRFEARRELRRRHVRVYHTIHTNTFI